MKFIDDMIRFYPTFSTTHFLYNTFDVCIIELLEVFHSIGLSTNQDHKAHLEEDKKSDIANSYPVYTNKNSE